MKLKTVTIDGKTYAEVQDGKPVFEADGKDVAFDAPGTVATISRLNAEAKSHREGKEQALEKLKGFEGITDPAAARKAMETVANLDAKKLIDAGQVELVKTEITKSFQEKIDSMTQSHASQIKQERDAREAITSQFHNEKIGSAFTGSKLIQDRFTIPADMVQARFGSAFKVEDGKLVAYDQAGNKIYSRARPAELATFDEAIETLVDHYPYRDNILKGKGGGSGAGAGNGNGGGGNKTVTRAEYEADPGKYAPLFAQGYTIAG